MEKIMLYKLECEEWDEPIIEIGASSKANAKRKTEAYDGQAMKIKVIGVRPFPESKKKHFLIGE